MATIDVSATTQKVQPYTGGGPIALVTFECDTAANPATTSDDLIIGYLPAYAIILGGLVEVVTAEGGTATIDIGTAENGQELGAGVNVNATAGTVTNIALANPIMVPSGATGIWVEPQNNLDAAVFKVHLLVAYTGLA